MAGRSIWLPFYQRLPAVQSTQHRHFAHFHSNDFQPHLSALRIGLAFRGCRFATKCAASNLASERVTRLVKMHSLAHRACIKSTLHFEFPNEIQRELQILIGAVQLQAA